MNNLSAMGDVSSDAGLRLGTYQAKFQQILVAVDFTETGIAVLKAAASLAKQFGGNLLLAHAVTPVLYGPGATPELLQADLDTAFAKMEVMVAKANLEDIPDTRVIEFAEPTDLIDRLARARAVDLVIVGTHGAHGWEKLAFGSVAESVLRKVPCPVMVIGPHCSEAVQLIQSIVFATRLGVTAFRPAQYASSVAEQLRARLTYLHVRKPELKEAEGATGEIQRLLFEELQQLLPPEAESFLQTKLRIEAGDASEQILRVALEEGANLIVLGVRESSSLADHSPKSTISQVIRGSRCPVLAVRGHLA